MRSRTPLDPVAFFLDECLPPQVARALSLVRFPITNAADQNKLGTKDPELIPWLSERGYVWITKDDAARVGHLPELRRAQLSVVWVRGFDRRKNMISDRELHLMLTVKLPEIEARLVGSVGRRHFLLYLSGEIYQANGRSSMSSMLRPGSRCTAAVASEDPDSACSAASRGSEGRHNR